MSRRIHHRVVATLVGVAALLGAAAAPATAASGGVERTPVMGWSSRSFLRMGVDAQRIEGEARALVRTGLSRAGYRYVNVDDNWYRCPRPGARRRDDPGDGFRARASRCCASRQPPAADPAPPSTGWSAPAMPGGWAM
jgi:hypothetical protein